jgi:hypothetical protein
MHLFRLCPVFLGPGPWGEWLEVDSKVRRSRQSSLSVDKPLDAGFDGLPLGRAGGDQRRTKALTIAERIDYGLVTPSSTTEGCWLRL